MNTLGNAGQKKKAFYFLPHSSSPLFVTSLPTPNEDPRSSHLRTRQELGQCPQSRVLDQWDSRRGGKHRAVRQQRGPQKRSRNEPKTSSLEPHRASSSEVSNLVSTRPSWLQTLTHPSAIRLRVVFPTPSSEQDMGGLLEGRIPGAALKYRQVLSVVTLAVMRTRSLPEDPFNPI